MTKYSDGSNRVHAGTPEREILAAIEEYERKAPDVGGELRRQLLDCVANLREELEIRKGETWRNS